MIRKKIKFFGRVQGVGFRYKASHAASALGLTGWVKNEWDDTVTMEVQGNEEAVDELLCLLQRDRYIRIERIEREDLPLDERESSFRVRGY